ncbi:MAG: hypothetical protein WC856_12375 [Methylococcaceae bacterium]|jgi:hypothetical protein
MNQPIIIFVISNGMTSQEVQYQVLSRSQALRGNVTKARRAAPRVAANALKYKPVKHWTQRVGTRKSVSGSQTPKRYAVRSLPDFNQYAVRQPRETTSQAINHFSG